MPNNKIRILLVDDHVVVRNGVRLMLSSESDIAVEGEAANAADALRLAGEQDFDVALVDIAMPGKNGLELLRLLRAEKPKLAVLILSTYSEEVYALRALKLGAAGYLMRRFSIPLTPAMFGVILGPMAEQQLRRALAISQGDLTVLVGSPLAVVLLALAATAVLLPIYLRSRGRGKMLAQLGANED